MPGGPKRLNRLSSALSSALLRGHVGLEQQRPGQPGLHRRIGEGEALHLLARHAPVGVEVEHDRATGAAQHGVQFLDAAHRREAHRQAIAAATGRRIAPAAAADRCRPRRRPRAAARRRRANSAATARRQRLRSSTAWWPRRGATSSTRGAEAPARPTAPSTRLAGSTGCTVQRATPSSSTPNTRLTPSIQAPARGSSAPAEAPTSSSGTLMPAASENSAVPPSQTSRVWLR